MTDVPSSQAASRQKRRQGFDREAYLKAHPRCCYCNGERPTNEVDHAPARICFRQRQGPEKMEAPSCSACNRAAAQSEQVAALYIRMADHNPSNLDGDDLRKLVEGVANNNPEAMPQINLDPPDGADVLGHNGGPPLAYEDLKTPPTLTIPSAANRHIALFATKILYAMFYRVSGSFAGPRHRRLVTWAQIGTPAALEIDRKTEQWFGDLKVGDRKNIDLGDQFHYRHGYNAAHGYLGLSMKFGQSLIFFCVLGPGKELRKVQGDTPRYCPIRELGVALARRRT